MGILQDRVALVTGASRGIGKASARALAQEGAKVALCARNAEAVRRAADEISPGGGRVLGFQADVTDKADVRNLVQSIVGRWGQIHILVNNAGINARIPIESDDDTGWRAVLDSTVLGAYYVTREVLRHMPDHTQPDGRVPGGLWPCPRQSGTMPRRCACVASSGAMACQSAWPVIVEPWINTIGAPREADRSAPKVS